MALPALHGAARLTVGLAGPQLPHDRNLDVRGGLPAQ